MAFKRGKQKSVMQHDFGQVARADIPRAQFDRSFGYKTTFDAGYLIPFLVDAIVPGDTVACKATLFARLATPLKPVMDNMRMETFFFFVPNRLVWENWQRFCGEQDDPGDSIDFTIPKLTNGAAQLATGTLADYFGIPVLGMTNFSQNDVSALPFRAYNLIWNDWFRDENLQDSLDVPIDNGPDTPILSLYDIRKRGKRQDYFTSALPWPQKGATAVTIPIGTSADIHTDAAAGAAPEVYATAVTDFRRLFTPSPVPAWVNVDTVAGVADSNKLYADLSTATAATINQLRQAFAIQKLLERDARGGTRYIEVIKSHFGVTSSDARLQRPEYLGGGSSTVGIQPVANTTGQKTASSPTGGDEFQGDLSGVGTVVTDGHGFTKSFEEHGYVIGLVNVRADLTYSQGLDRDWSRATRYDFLWPVFSHIGEQAIYNREIFVDGTATDADVFGYNGRYDEYRYKNSMITGLFRPDAAGSLDVWHLSQDFATHPTLGDTFIQEDPPIDRVIAVPSEPHFLMDGYVSYKHARPLPLFGTPGLIDHF